MGDKISQLKNMKIKVMNFKKVKDKIYQLKNKKAKITNLEK